MHDIVVGAIELALERALERLDLRPQVGLVGRHAQHPHRSLALDVRLVTFTHHQEIDGVERRQRADHVAELDPRAPWPRHRTKSRQQHPGHGGTILGQLAWTRKAEW